MKKLIDELICAGMEQRLEQSVIDFLTKSIQAVQRDNLAVSSDAESSQATT